MASVFECDIDPRDNLEEWLLHNNASDSLIQKLRDNELYSMSDTFYR